MTHFDQFHGLDEKKPKIVNIKIFKPKKIILKYYFRDISLESDSKKMRKMFVYIVFLILMIMLFGFYILKVDTLTIPKW